ncbi:MAG TPA: hypothetical protein VD813_04615 [Pseudonocardia sp.]|nr:hypothetical protein [Pseudonocardia sp.]
MRTVCGTARRIEVAVGRGRRLAPSPVRPLAAARHSLLSDGVGEQRRGGVRLDQVDGTTCGSAVLVALAAWADPAEVERLAGTGGDVGPGLGLRWDARQRQVHRQTNRFWPRALGTTPWAMVRWLREHVPGAGPYRVRLVDDASSGDVAAALDEIGAALAVGRPVPMLVGSFLPRHYVLALGPVARAGEGRWRVYEPTSGTVRALDPGLARRRALRGVLGYDRLHAALLPG